MILRRQMRCGWCGQLTDLRWETIAKDGLTVHNVPIYRCACGKEWHELRSMVVYDTQVRQANLRNAEEITLEYPDVILMDCDEPVPEDLLQRLLAEVRSA